MVLEFILDFLGMNLVVRLDVGVDHIDTVDELQKSQEADYQLKAQPVFVTVHKSS